MTELAAKKTRPGFALCTAILLTGTLGSIHAFSVFGFRLAAIHGVSSTTVSLIYSLALVMLTVAVLAAHFLFRRLPPATLVAGVCLLSAGGLMLAAKVQGLASFYLGYGLIFGFANGIGYALALQLAAHALPARKGAAMGAVTAFYALGAMFFGAWFEARYSPPTVGHLPQLSWWWIEGCLVDLSHALLLVMIVGVPLCLRSGIVITQSQGTTPKPEGQTTGTSQNGLTIRLWFGYGLGCLAGLMAIGHATGIVYETGDGTYGAVAWAVTLISFGNAAGGFIAGHLADRLPQKLVLTALPLLSSFALLGLAVADDPGLALAFLAMVGFCYGAIIAVYPAATAQFVGLADSARVYGRIFTAWGVAGLLGPWIAGLLYDLLDSYSAPLLIAAIAALASAQIVRQLPSSAR